MDTDFDVTARSNIPFAPLPYGHRYGKQKMLVSFVTTDSVYGIAALHLEEEVASNFEDELEFIIDYSSIFRIVDFKCLQVHSLNCSNCWLKLLVGLLSSHY